MLLVGCVALHCSVKVNIVINYVSLFILTIIFHFLIPKHVSRHEISPPKKRGKREQQQIFLGKVYSNFAAPVAFAKLGLSLHRDRCVPPHKPRQLRGGEGRKQPGGMQLRAGCRQGLCPGQGEAGILTSTQPAW